MRVKVINGETTHFWFDNWTGSGRFIDFVGELGPQQLGIPRGATVASVSSPHDVLEDIFFMPMRKL